MNDVPDPTVTALLARVREGDGEARAIRVVLETDPQPILREAHAARLNDGNAHATASLVSVVVKRQDRAG